MIGDSLAECSVSPLDIWHDFGITAYNCGTGNQTLPEAKEYIENVFHNQSPKIILLEANELYLDCPTADILSQKMEIMFPVVRYHDLWKILKPSDYLRSSQYTYLDPCKGFHPSSEIVPPADRDLEKYMKPSTKTNAVSKKNAEFVRQIRDFCIEKHAQLVLYSAPSVTNWNTKRHNGVEELAKNLDISYLDLNLMQDEISIVWNQDTMDEGNHLNSYGASKVSKWLGAYLMNTGLFADKRNDAAFSAWNDAYKDYSVTIR